MFFRVREQSFEIIAVIRIEFETYRPDGGEGKVGLSGSVARKRNLASSEHADFRFAFKSSFWSILASSRIWVVVEVQHADFECFHLSESLRREAQMIVLDLESTSEVICAGRSA